MSENTQRIYIDLTIQIEHLLLQIKKYNESGIFDLHVNDHDKEYYTKKNKQISYDHIKNHSIKILNYSKILNSEPKCLEKLSLLRNTKEYSELEKHEDVAKLDEYIQNMFRNMIEAKIVKAPDLSKLINIADGDLIKRFISAVFEGGRTLLHSQYTTERIKSIINMFLDESTDREYFLEAVKTILSEARDKSYSYDANDHYSNVLISESFGIPLTEINRYFESPNYKERIKLNRSILKNVNKWLSTSLYKKIQKNGITGFISHLEETQIENVYNASQNYINTEKQNLINVLTGKECEPIEWLGNKVNLRAFIVAIFKPKEPQTISKSYFRDTDNQIIRLSKPVNKDPNYQHYIDSFRKMLQ